MAKNTRKEPLTFPSSGIFSTFVTYIASASNTMVHRHGMDTQRLTGYPS